MPRRLLGRLRKGPEFDTVYSEGVVIGGPLCVVRVRPNGLEVSRWGFAVGKKMLPGAVDRNRVRRRMREAAAALPEIRGYDVVVTARPAAVGASFSALVAALQGALVRLEKAVVS